MRGIARYCRSFDRVAGLPKEISKLEAQDTTFIQGRHFNY